jgi:multidrug efflux pump subunit AcrB
MAYSIPYDTTRFVEVSIREVMYTLAEAMILVFLVIYLFLQSWRAAIIPFAAVPVALIGAFAGIYALGYSINTLTLFAMVLAIGIVVDDAIVVLENVERHMREDKLPARDAALRAMREVTGPIIAIVLTLTAVFVPIAFLGGLTGELYRQFAVTIAMSVVCRARRAHAVAGAVRAGAAPARGAEPLLRRVQPLVRARHRALHRRRLLDASPRRIAGLLFLGMVAVTVLLWRIDARLARPDEDQGFYISAGDPAGRRDARAHREGRRPGRAEAIRSNPNNLDIVAFTGFDFIGGGYRNNAATIFVTQKHWDERDVDAAQLVGELFGKTMGIKEALVLAFNPPAIFGLGTAGGFEFYIQNRGDGEAKRLDEVTQAFLARANSDPQLGGAQTLWRATVPQLSVDVDREKAKTLGVPITDVYNALSRHARQLTTSTTSTSTAARGRC